MKPNLESQFVLYFAFMYSLCACVYVCAVHMCVSACACVGYGVAVLLPCNCGNDMSSTKKNLERVEWNATDT